MDLVKSFGNLNLPDATPYTTPTPPVKMKINATILCIIGALKLANVPSGARNKLSSGNKANTKPTVMSNKTKEAK